ncbi:MAG: hypothetical protein K8H88_05975 [Sandaracinaceae bacterium]|nr:hypothetical protein [Sandaracinaceae bacterium]
MDARALDRIARYVGLSGALLSAIAFLLGGAALGAGALVGAAMALANWQAVRWLGKQLLKANDKGKMIWGTLLAVKMTAVLVIVWLVLSTGWVDPVGFAIGMSALVVGALIGAFTSALAPEPSGSSEPASEES